jgi:hypothetical protein
MLLTRYAQIATTQEKSSNYLVRLLLLFSPRICGPLADDNLLEIFPDTARLCARRKPHVRYVLGSFSSSHHTLFSYLLCAVRSALRRRVQPKLAR